jgi:hypothetical protein
VLTETYQAACIWDQHGLGVSLYLFQVLSAAFEGEQGMMTSVQVQHSGATLSAVPLLGLCVLPGVSVGA